MTVSYQDDWLTIYGGDCRTVLADLPAESVHCVVTSPPYWGLRDYGTATWEGGEELHEHVGDVMRTAPPGTEKQASNHGALSVRSGNCRCGAVRIDSQLGLEPTPEQYVENMVAVFREVRRVLRSDGTVWLNLGSSYAAGDNGTSPSRQRPSAPAYGTDGTGQLGSPGLGSAYSGLCDGCLAAQSNRTTDTPRPPLVSPLRDEPTARDSEPVGSGSASLDASPLDVLASTTTRSEPPPPGPCSHCGNCGACLSVLRSSSRDARECVRSSWLNYPTFKPKDMVPTPWLVALALQADGWYLRSDIIWSKPNPMPESVTDRPTKSHEYLFLLAKSPRYYFDADAVREPAGEWPGHDDAPQGSFHGKNGDKAFRAIRPSGRNIRTVWTVATQPYPGAHFAVFPEKLIEPCILAGCPVDGVVLDPFGGSGTTARVANRLSRRAVLIDLNPDYLKQQMDRNRDIPLGLGA